MWRLGHMVQAGSSNFDEWVKAIARRRQNTYRIIYEAIVSALFHKKKPISRTAGGGGGGRTLNRVSERINWKKVFHIRSSHKYLWSSLEKKKETACMEWIMAWRRRKARMEWPKERAHKNMKAAHIWHQHKKFKDFNNDEEWMDSWMCKYW